MVFHGFRDGKVWGLTMLKVRFTPLAIADLEEIKRYISNDLFNPQAAAELVSLVFGRIGVAYPPEEMILVGLKQELMKLWKTQH